MRRNECFRFGGIWEACGEITRRGGMAAERMSARRNGCLRFRENMGSVEMVTRRRDARTRRERITRRWQCPLDTFGKDNADFQPGVVFYSTAENAAKMLAAEEGISPQRRFGKGNPSGGMCPCRDFSAEKGSAE